MPFDPPFSGYIQPPGVPPDPTGDCWRGPPGPQGPPGPVGTGDASNTPVTATGSTTPRMLQDRAADWVNVKDFGAKIDGTTDDNTAMNAARGAVAAGGTIYVPTGGFWNLPTLTSGPAAGNVLWHLSGNHFGAGTTPVTSVGNFDLVETYLTGTSGVKYWGKNFPLNAGPALRLDVGLTQTGGTEGHVSTGLQINTTQGAGTVESVWGIVVNATTNADRDLSGAGFWPQCVPIVVNQFKKAGAQCWGIGIYVDDSTLTSSATAGGINGMEMGLKVCGLDDALGSTNTGYGARRFLDLIATTHGSGPAGEVGNGVLVRSGVGSNASVHHGFHTLNNVGYSFVCEATTGIIGLDTSLATLSGSAVRLAAGQKLSFEATEGNYLRYDSASSKLLYYVGGVAKWSVDASGNMRCAGTVTGSVTP